MSSEEFTYQVLYLTSTFYNAYPNPPYTEILQKQRRAYNCLLLETHYDYYICIPYRSEINHDNAFLFKYSRRSINHKSGLDYSKIIIIKDSTYITEYDAIIDQDEYNETRDNIVRIKNEAEQYIDDYVNHIKGNNIIHPKEYNRRYKYTTLKYFHKELGL